MIPFVVKLADGTAHLKAALRLSYACFRIVETQEEALLDGWQGVPLPQVCDACHAVSAALTGLERSSFRAEHLQQPITFSEREQAAIDAWKAYYDAMAPWETCAVSAAELRDARAMWDKHLVPIRHFYDNEEWRRLQDIGRQKHRHAHEGCRDP